MNQPHEAAAAISARLIDRLGHVWWVFMTRGIIAVVFGIITLIWPQKSLIFLVWLAGGYLVLDGISSLFMALRSGDSGGSLWQGIASTAGGAAILLWPGITASFLLVVLGIWALVLGVGLIRTGAGMRAEGGDEGSLLHVAGAVLALFGIIALLWRGVGATALAWLIALVAMVVGALLILVAKRLKRLQQRITGSTS
jgi:uncharacterized membrane protein HdeD (DUF308 family)